MKKTYLTPSTRAIAIKGGFRLLQQHSVRNYIQEGTRYIGDIDEDKPAPPGSRFIGVIDEE